MSLAEFKRPSVHSTPGRVQTAQKALTTAMEASLGQERLQLLPLGQERVDLALRLVPLHLQLSERGHVIYIHIYMYMYIYTYA